MLGYFVARRSYLTQKRLFSKVNEQYKHDILRSQFHQKGHQHFPKSKRMVRNINNNAIEIEKVLLDLQKLRIPLQQASSSYSAQLISTSSFLDSSNEESEKYFRAYLELIRLIEESNIDEEWFYRIVGWYNLQPFREAICEKLFDYTKKSEHLLLVESINWMQPHLYKPSSKMELYEIKKRQKKIEDYYKRLNLTHPISFVQSVENILKNTWNSHKSKYFSKYVDMHLPKLIQNIKGTETIDEIFWLLKIYFESYNDSQAVIETLTRFLLNFKLSLSHQHIQILMNIFGKIGNINPQVYQAYIKKHIHESINSQIQKVVESLEFMIYSEAEDPETLNSLLKKLSSSQKQSEIDDYLKHRVHLLVHYLQIKGQEHQINLQFNKKLSQCCRDYQGNGEVARMMAIQLDEKARIEGQPYFISDCLRRNRLNMPVRQDKAQAIKHLPQEYKKYNNIRFCTININTCVLNVETKEFVILQSRHRRFEHSGRLSRAQVIRDTILTHYGFKINYMEAKEYNKASVMPMPDEQ